MKNKSLFRKILFFSICVFSVAGISYFVYKTFFINNKVEKNEISKEYKVSIDGAVKNPGNYFFEQPKTIREIIFEASVLTSADISILNLEEIIFSDFEIVVPFKIDSIKKIKWKDLVNVDQLTNLGVKKSISQIIINHRRQNETTTWEQILALKGIGQVTLNQLKDLIDLS